MNLAARLVLALSGFALFASVEARAACPDTLDFSARQLATDEVVNLCEAYRGKVVLIVNTASKCAYTDQYEGLEALYDQYRDRGLVVLGFPSNDFGGQEPGTEQEIKRFCRLTYSVKFPMFEKTHVRKDRADPLYRLLGEQAGEFPQVPARPRRATGRQLWKFCPPARQQADRQDRDPAVTPDRKTRRRRMFEMAIQ